jgi:hypothetical protein
VALDHLLHPQGEADGHDGGEAFGDGGNGETEGGQEDIDDVLLLGLPVVEKPGAEGIRQVGVPDESIDEDDRADGEAGRPENLSQMLQLLLERRILLLVGLDHLRNETDLRAHARARHQSLAASIRDQRAQERGVPAVAQRYFLIQNHRRILFHGHRFSRQRGFFDLEIDGGGQAHIGGHVIARIQEDDVARNEFPRRSRDLMAVAYDLGVGGRHFLQGLDGLFRLRLLNNSDDGIQDDDAHDGDGIDILAEQQGDTRRDDQDDHQVVIELLPQEREKPRPGPLREFIGAEFCETLPRLFVAQAFVEVRLKFPDHGVNRLSVGVSLFHTRLFLSVELRDGHRSRSTPVDEAPAGVGEREQDGHRSALHRRDQDRTARPPDDQVVHRA